LHRLGRLLGTFRLTSLEIAARQGHPLANLIRLLTKNGPKLQGEYFGGEIKGTCDLSHPRKHPITDGLSQDPCY
jgi:hypothetical protein